MRNVILSAAFVLAPAAADAAPDAYSGSLYPAAPDAQPASPAGLSPQAAAQSGVNSNFDDLIAQAVSRHPLLQIEESEAAIARAETRAARAALYPRLSASIDADYVIDREFGASMPNVVESIRPNGQVNAGLTASQLVFDGGASFARIKAARARNRERERTIVARINDLALRALSVYLDAAVQQGMARLGAEYVARHQKLVRDMKERERLGAGAKAEALRAEARLAAAKARAADFAEMPGPRRSAISSFSARRRQRSTFRITPPPAFQRAPKRLLSPSTVILRSPPSRRALTVSRRRSARRRAAACQNFAPACQASAMTFLGERRLRHSRRR